MNQKQQNIRTMFGTTLDFLDKNSAVWSGRPAFADAVTRARAAVGAIGSAGEKQAMPTTGVAEDKQSLRDDLEDKTLEIADQLSAFAAKKGDHNLGAQVEMTKSTLDRMQETDLIDTADRVGNLANAHLAELVPFEITAADITALNDASAAFSGDKSKPRQAAVDRSVQTQSLPELIAAARSIFRNELDKLMTKFRKTDPDFYNGYFAARVIVDRAATQKSNGATPAPAPAKPNA
jgi:hypothetical protein